MNGPGRVILIVRSVLRRRNSTSRTSTGLRPADRADDARHPRAARPDRVDRRRIVEIDALERGGEAVGVALAADLAVGDDVDAGALHVADREHRGVVLRLLEPGPRGCARSCARTRGTGGIATAGAVDQPVRLRIAADDGGRKRVSVITKSPAFDAAPAARFAENGGMLAREAASYLLPIDSS